MEHAKALNRKASKFFMRSVYIFAKGPGLVEGVRRSSQAGILWEKTAGF